MAISGKNSDLIRRFKFYGFGLALGILAVSVITKGKACQMPGSAKLEELNWQKLEYSKHAACRMECRHISESEIKQVLQEGKINYNKSEVHDKPYPTYAIEGTTTQGKNIRVVIADADTISKVITTIDLNLEKDSCDCK
jgi:signal recognition particle subunit SEC65